MCAHRANAGCATLKDAVTKTKEEETEEAEAAKAKLGLDKDEPKSAAEKKDREKRAALKEAKKMWDDKKATEQQQKFVFDGEKGVTRALTRADVDHRPVLVIKGASGSAYTLTENLGTLIKVFIEECEDTKIILQCQVITQHVEVSHSERVNLVVAVPLQTVQVDLSSDIVITYQQSSPQNGPRRASADDVRQTQCARAAKCTTLASRASSWSARMKATRRSTTTWTSPRTPMRPRRSCSSSRTSRTASSRRSASAAPWGAPFVCLRALARLTRARSMMPLTDEELSKVAGTVEIENAARRQALEKKTDGNEAFKNGECLQAAVLYTQAMKLAPSDTEVLTTCLANRAACNLKLGRLDEALEDANACVELDPKHVKGWFRKGMALHAMKAHGPAVAALSKAHDLEPKNKQVADAIGFAKVMLAKQLKEEQEKV